MPCEDILEAWKPMHNLRQALREVAAGYCRR
jgi:hypothetical protein